MTTQTGKDIGLTPDNPFYDALAETHSERATKVYDENIGGGIFEGFIQQGAGDVITGFDLSDGPSGDRKVWFIPNGGGITVMFPEDY